MKPSEPSHLLRHLFVIFAERSLNRCHNEITYTITNAHLSARMWKWTVSPGRIRQITNVSWYLAELFLILGHLLQHLGQFLHGGLKEATSACSRSLRMWKQSDTRLSMTLLMLLWMSWFIWNVGSCCGQYCSLCVCGGGGICVCLCVCITQSTGIQYLLYLFSSVHLFAGREFFERASHCPAQQTEQKRTNNQDINRVMTS